MTKSLNIGLVSLGCPKALVDSEHIITSLRAQGYSFSADYAGADIVIVNSCGFINSAKAESLEAIGEAIDKNGKVIVTGCLGVEEQLIRSIHPKVLAISGPHQYEEVIRAVHKYLPPEPNPFTNLVPQQGLKLTPKHYSYLKISEGCNNSCSFCIIPNIRGPLKSRPIASILYEAERLVKAGTKELLIISQDTGAYGMDIKYAKSKYYGKEIEAKFSELANYLAKLNIWVRFHYIYPYPHIDAILPLMADSKILPYLDIPFQHASPKILKSMRRPANQEKTLNRIKKWRKICPDLAIRSTFIVGFPGESEEDFEFLLDWIKEAEIDRIGCFEYEPVDGAKANQLGNQIDPKIKSERYERLMQVAQDISAKRLALRVGQVTELLVDKIDFANNRAIARSKWDAPDIDGVVYIEGIKSIKEGDFCQVKITASDNYDLWGIKVKNNGQT